MEHDGRFVLLQRQPHKVHGNKWGLPAGKVNGGETVVEAMIRELHEETGITANHSELIALIPLWVENNSINFNYHSFSLKLNEEPTILLNKEEHQNYQWVTPAESLKMDLIHDLDVCNKLFFNL